VTANIQFASIDWNGRLTQIEYQWLNGDQTDKPLVIFLHEGLGSLSMWKAFPQTFCDALGYRGLVYSRPGYGGSTPRVVDEKWEVDFMHRQAYEVLPELLDSLKIDLETNSVVLFGHSDGGSIALLFASRYSDYTEALIVLAPHIFVEDVSVVSIKKARETYLSTDLRSRLARYHDDPDSAFWGWNDIWLSERFRSWSIESELKMITCPLLAVQGLDDDYGSLAQIRDIKNIKRDTELLELESCGHSPHRDQPEALLNSCQQFVAGMVMQQG
jgi:pimeloyl-ACP methyl ester carboxylesterase